MGLNLNQVPSGTRIFIDSNIFLYIFLKHPKFGEICQKFIKRRLHILHQTIWIFHVYPDYRYGNLNPNSLLNSIIINYDRQFY